MVGFLKTKLFFLAALLLFTVSCGYHWQPDSSIPSISLPFIEGDEEGQLTNEVAHAIALSGIGELQSHGGAYRLQIALCDSCSETIGFRRDRQKVDGKNKKNMLACEARKTIAAEVTLFRESSQEIVFGPEKIEADIDFDYVDNDCYKDLTFVDPEGFTQAVLPFSLGQLEPYESAQDAAMCPLYRNLAQKIVDMVSSKWHENTKKLPS